MKNCNRCQVSIKGVANRCPLCGEILVSVSEEAAEPMYPKIALNSNAFHILKRVLFFIMFVITITLFIINYFTYDIAPVLWSLISVAAIGYGVVTVYYSILNNSNLASKLLVQTIGACILSLIIDNVLGFTGWSINFIIPSLILLSDLAIIILMIVNPMKGRAYFMYQITLSIFTVSSFLLCLTNLIVRKELAIIAGLTCFVTLIGSILFGEKGLQNELIRRFHI